MFTFKPAVRERANLLLALAGPSGSGKTLSALKIATGLINGGTGIAVIDTECGRASHYAEQMQFDHLVIGPPFTPERYLDAVQTAETAGYDVIVVDSLSHEYDGEGGIIEIADKMLEDNPHMKAPANWNKPKQRHRKMMNGFLQVRAHLIFCLRAEQKIGIEKDERGRTVIVDRGWVPVTEKRAMYEMTASHLLDPSNPGVPLPIKLPDYVKQAFPQGRLITEETGRILKEWAHGGVQPAPEPKKSTKEYALELKSAIDVARAERDEDSLNELESEIQTAGETGQLGPKQTDALLKEVQGARQTIEAEILSEDEPEVEDAA